MKFNFNIFMTIWCAVFAYYSLFWLICGTSYVILHLICIAVQSFVGYYNWKEEKQFFKEKIKDFFPN